MIGLISKDLIVFQKRFGLLYRAACTILLAAVILLLPHDGARYIALVLPFMGVAFLTEIVKVEEKSDWKDYLPVLPITNRDIVLSRYAFCALLLAAVSAISLAACVLCAAIHHFALASVMPSFILGVWFGLLVMCVSIPSGYFFKNEVCTSAMMWCLLPFGFATNLGFDGMLLRASFPAAAALFLLTAALMLGVSYMVSLWVYATKRHQKTKTAQRA